jgi:hypothetical protein
MDGGERTIRKIVDADRDWIHEVSAKAYASNYYDPAAAEAWFRKMMADDNHLLLRGEFGFMTAYVSGLPWLPSRLRGAFGPVASIGGPSFKAAGDLLDMTRMCLAWAKERGAVEFYFGAVTGVDFSALAKRFGGRAVSPYYVVDL